MQGTRQTETGRSRHLARFLSANVGINQKLRGEETKNHQGNFQCSPSMRQDKMSPPSLRDTTAGMGPLAVCGGDQHSGEEPIVSGSHLSSDYLEFTAY